MAEGNGRERDDGEAIGAVEGSNEIVESPRGIDAALQERLASTIHLGMMSWRFWPLPQRRWRPPQLHWPWKRAERKASGERPVTIRLLRQAGFALEMQNSYISSTFS